MMANDFESLLKSGKRSDVVLLVGEKKIRAHKHVLSARSPVFAAMFAYDTKESQENRIEMIDVDVEMVELMVRYSYSGKVDNLDRYAEDLLIVADRYQMDCLKLECEQYLSSQISVSSFSDLLFFADTYHATVLTSECLNYIARNVTQMIDSEEWDKIAKTDLLSKIRKHLNLCFAEQNFLSQITTESFVDLLIFADTYQVIELYMTCLECIAHNLARLVTSEEWDKIAKTDLLSKICERLNLCFSEQNFLSQITTESFADLLIFADTYQVIELYMTCLEYIAHNLARLVTSEGINKIVANADLLDKLCASLNLNFSEQKFFFQISCDSVVNLLIFADTYQVTVLYRKCLEYFTNNFAKVVASKDWMKIAVRSDLLVRLYDHLHLEYSKAIANDNGEKMANSIKSSKKKKQKKPKNCTSGPDLDFEKYLLKYSNVINGKEEMTDVVLLVGDSELKVHKSILSTRSPVFKAMFSRDEHENRVQITNVNVKVLKVLIKYIYSGKVERLVRYLAELLVVADKYQVVGFKSICERQLLSKVITTESVSDLVIIADMHQFAELYAKCIDYIANNAEEVMWTFRYNKKIVVKVDLLAKICEQLNWNISELFWCWINVELVCYLLILAVMAKNTEFTAECIDYITHNRTQVMSTEGWKKLLIRTDLLNMLFEHLSFIYAQVLHYRELLVNYRDYDYNDDDYDDCFDDDFEDESDYDSVYIL